MILRDAHLFRQYDVVRMFAQKFGFQNTLDYDWSIYGSYLDKLINGIASNDKEYSRLFQVKRYNVKIT